MRAHTINASRTVKGVLALACSSLLACGGSKEEETVTYATLIPAYADFTRMYYLAVERELQARGVNVISRKCGPYEVSPTAPPGFYLSQSFAGGGEWGTWWVIYYTVPASQNLLMFSPPIPPEPHGLSLSPREGSSYQYLVTPRDCGALPESIIGEPSGF